MNSNLKILLAGCFFACAPAFASITFCTTTACMGTINDTTNWAQLGGDTTPLGPFQAISLSSVNVFGSFSGTDDTGLVADVCPASPSCSWGPATPGEISAGDSLVWAFDPSADGGNGAGTGPLNLLFLGGTSPLLGGGLWLQAGGTGVFTATIQGFDGGGTSLGAASSETSDAAGDPIFLGLLSSTANIGELIFNVTSCATCSDPSLPDFAVDTLQMVDPAGGGSPTPEPSSMLLFGSGLAGMAWLLRKRSLKNDRRS